MPTFYPVGNETIDALDLKFMLLTHGAHVRPEVYEALSATHRLSPDPYQCNGLILPDRTVAHLGENGPGAPFHVTMGENGRAQLLHNGAFVTEVSFPKATKFYQQTSSSGMPFRGVAVLEGHDMLAFAYLWSCAYTTPGMACKFCHCGVYTEMKRAAKDPNWSYRFSPQDVGEAIRFAVCEEGSARNIELTGGSTFADAGEVPQMVEVLQGIDRVAGLKNIPGDLHIYTTPPKEPATIDALFDAGADFVSCNIEVWDEALAAEMTPGKAKWTGRQRHVDTMLHIARTRGQNHTCCTFVSGLEPAESLLEGARYLAENGVTPLVSVLMPHGLPAMPQNTITDIEHFRAVKRGLAAIYDQFNCEPPGQGGSHVSVARDIWNNRKEILQQIAQPAGSSILN